MKETRELRTYTGTVELRMDGEDSDWPAEVTGVAAVATLCQDERVFAAMLAAGTPCPVDGKIGERAKEEWQARGVLDNNDKKAIGNYATKSVVLNKEVTTESPKQ